MAIKISLEKAYDKPNQGFLLDTMVNIIIPYNLVQVVTKRVMNSSMQVLRNGRKLQPFHPSRGLKQGDPLSLYLFVRCMEQLSHGIQKAVNLKQQKPIQLSRGGLGITHLFC